MYKERTYRQWVKSEGLVTFEVKELETDLSISAVRNLEEIARASVLNYRQDIESYIKEHRDFFTSLEPVNVAENVPGIVKAMALAGKMAGVGPMAAVAGAVAEFVGRDLLALSDEIIVENGGDIFIKSAYPRLIGIYAGNKSPFTGKIAVEIPPTEQGIGVCTSSGTVSHSLSFGRADAVLIISANTALADAAATAAGNAVKCPESIEKGIDIARSIEGVDGVLILAADKMGSWGNVKLA